MNAHVQVLEASLEGWWQDRSCWSGTFQGKVSAAPPSKAGRQARTSWRGSAGEGKRTQKFPCPVDFRAETGARTPGLVLVPLQQGCRADGRCIVCLQKRVVIEDLALPSAWGSCSSFCLPELRRGQMQPERPLLIALDVSFGVFQALMSLFVLASKDGWVNIMYNGLDAVAVDQQVGMAGAASGLGSGRGTKWSEAGVSKPQCLPLSAAACPPPPALHPPPTPDPQGGCCSLAGASPRSICFNKPCSRQGEHCKLAPPGRAAEPVGGEAGGGGGGEGPSQLRGTTGAGLGRTVMCAGSHESGAEGGGGRRVAGGGGGEQVSRSGRPVHAAGAERGRAGGGQREGGVGGAQGEAVRLACGSFLRAAGAGWIWEWEGGRGPGGGWAHRRPEPWLPRSP